MGMKYLLSRKLSGKKSQQHCKDRIQHLKKRLEGLPKGPPQLITVSTPHFQGMIQLFKDAIIILRLLKSLADLSFLNIFSDEVIILRLLKSLPDLSFLNILRLRVIDLYILTKRLQIYFT